MSAPRHALTVDVEDWYHVENLRPVAPASSWPGLESRLEANVDRMLAQFGERGVRATFFVLGVAAERVPGIVRRIVDGGHELACHGWSHELIYRQTPQVFREETRRAKAFLEDHGGCAVHGYRASTFSVTKRSLWALDILAEEGFTYDSSIAPLRHDRYGIPDAPTAPYRHRLASRGTLIEFPVAVGRWGGVRFPIGGGFFRLLPLRATLREFRRAEAAGRASMIYLHPWEIDPGQPRPAGLGPLRRFRHYFGLAHTQAKLERLLGAVRFAPVADVLDAALQGSR